MLTAQLLFAFLLFLLSLLFSLPLFLFFQAISSSSLVFFFNLLILLFFSLYFFHDLNHILIVEQVIFTHTLRLMFH